jgi:membrane associated rhomboid family serine protease
VFVLPLRDVIPSRTAPFITVGLIVLNALVFLFEPTLSNYDLHALLTSLFLHSGWGHVLGNMLFLWIFGDNLEDRIGHGRFLLLYLACGGAAALGQTLAAPGTLVPMIGASGAIAGVIGAYFVLFPHSRVLTLVWLIFYVDLIEIPAWYFLGFWFVLQLLFGFGTVAGETGGVALWAHAVGFLAGMALVLILRRPERTRIEWIE